MISAFTIAKMQKRIQEQKRNDQSEYLSSDAEVRSESVPPKKRARLTINRPDGDDESLHTFSQNLNDGNLRESPTSSPVLTSRNNETTSVDNTGLHKTSANAASTVTVMSPSIHDDEFEKRSAFREVGQRTPRTQTCDDIEVCHGAKHAYYPVTCNTTNYSRTRPCGSIFTDYSYLGHPLIPVPMAVPRGGAISRFPSHPDAARWQHQAATNVAAAHYASYYQHFPPKTRVELKTETERYMGRLLAQERTQADNFALRCVMDKTALSVSPNFVRRLPEHLASPSGITTFPRPENVIDSNHVSPWQRQLLPGAVFPLSSSMFETSENWCAKCNASFRMTSDLVYHMRTHHKRNLNEDPEKKSQEGKLRCDVCNETFRERHHLTRHMTSHVNG